MRRKLAALATAIALALPSGAQALGLGDVKLSSGLNQPLRAEIALLGATPEELEGLQVQLADAEEFARLGIEQAAILSRLRFEVTREGPDKGLIRVTSTQPVREPFLSFLLEINWPRGRLLREYTVLLDPPVFGAAASRAVRGPVVRADEQTALTPRPPAARAEAERPAPAAVKPARAASPPVAAAAPGQYGPVAYADTLWAIAGRVRPAGVSHQQMMVALLRANPEAFRFGNVNNLQAGAVLRIPAAGELAAIDANAALAEIKRQNVQWEEFRQGIARTPGPAPAVAVKPAPAAAVPGTAAAEPAAPSTEDDDRALLELLSPGLADRGPGGTESEPEEVAELRKQVALGQEELDSKVRENEELRSQVADLEHLVTDLQRLIQMKEDELAALQARLGAEGTAAREAFEPPPAAPTEPVVPAVPVPEAAEVPVPSPSATPEPILPPPAMPEPPAFISAIRDNPTLIGGGLAGAFLLAGLGLWLRGRRRRGEQTGEVGPETLTPGSAAMPLAGGTGGAAAVLPSTAQEAEVEAEEEAEEEITAPRGEVAFAPDRTLVGLGRDEDPLAEANVYLAYERFDQAESLVRQAVADHPDRQDYKLKLLEIHHASKDGAAFERDAAVLRDAVGEDSPLMEKAAAWWHDLSPERDLFAPVPEGAPESAAEQADSAARTGTFAEFTDTTRVATSTIEMQSPDVGTIDFDLGLGADGSADLPPGANELDFSLEFGEGTAVTPEALDLGFEEAFAADQPLDFELPTMEGEESPYTGTGLDFDLDAGAEATEPAMDEQTLDFQDALAEQGEREGASGPTDSAGRAGAEELPALEFELADEVLPEERPADLVADSGAGPEVTETAVADEPAGPAEEAQEAEEEVASSAPMDEAPPQDAARAAAETPSSEPVFEEPREGAAESPAEAERPLGEDTVVLAPGDGGPSPAKSPVADDTGLDFDLALLAEDDGVPSDEQAPPAAVSSDFDIDLEMEHDGEGDELSRILPEDMDEVGTKLDLAQAYIDMGDADGARAILDEVLAEGTEAQRAEAQELLARID